MTFNCTVHLTLIYKSFDCCQSVIHTWEIENNCFLPEHWEPSTWTRPSQQSPPQPHSLFPKHLRCIQAHKSSGHDKDQIHSWWPTSARHLWPWWHQAEPRHGYCLCLWHCLMDTKLSLCHCDQIQNNWMFQEQDENVSLLLHGQWISCNVPRNSKTQLMDQNFKMCSLWFILEIPILLTVSIMC